MGLRFAQLSLKTPTTALLNHFFGHVPCRDNAGSIPFFKLWQGFLVSIQVRAMFRFAAVHVPMH